MIKQKDVVVSGTEYKLTQFPATKGVALLKQLTKLLGPSFAEMAKGAEGADGVMGLAMEKLIENLDNVNVEELVKYLVMNGASKGSAAIEYDTEFAGEYDKLFKLVQEVVEFNFGSVFTLLGGAE